MLYINFLASQTFKKYQWKALFLISMLLRLGLILAHTDTGAAQHSSEIISNPIEVGSGRGRIWAALKLIQAVIDSALNI